MEEEDLVRFLSSNPRPAVACRVHVLNAGCVSRVPCSPLDCRHPRSSHQSWTTNFSGPSRRFPRTVEIGTPSHAPPHSQPAWIARPSSPCRAPHRDCRIPMEWPASQLSHVLFFWHRSAPGGISGSRTRCRQRAQLQMAIIWPTREPALRGLFQAPRKNEDTGDNLLVRAHLLVPQASAGDPARPRPLAERGRTDLGLLCRAHMAGTETA